MKPRVAGSAAIVQRHHRERGQTLPLIGISFVVLLGFAGFAIDTGYERYQQRAQQSATDSAALAGATELIYSPTGTTAIARTDAASNGFVHDGLKTTITVNAPPLAGPNIGNTKAVEVVIDGSRPTFFEMILGASNQTIETRATALLAPPTRRPCIVALLPSPNGLSLNSPNVTAPNCGIISNGNYSASSGTVIAAQIGVVGSISSGSTSYPDASPTATIPLADPCMSIPGCAYLRANPPPTAPCDYTGAAYSSATVTLSPGIFCGGTTFNSSNVTLNPGTYVFPGGITTNASTISGTGVTLVMPAGGVTTLNAGSFDITAPTSGPLAGMVFYQPASNTGQIKLNGNKTRNIQGVIYAPSAPFISDAGFTATSLLIAGTITLNSGSMDVPTNVNFPLGIQSAVLTQ